MNFQVPYAHLVACERISCNYEPATLDHPIAPPRRRSSHLALQLGLGLLSERRPGPRAHHHIGPGTDASCLIEGREHR